MRLEKVLESVAQQMRADFSLATAEVAHRGEKGGLREATVVEYLRKYLPRTIAVLHSGEAVTASGLVSGQCDVLLVDASTPPLFERPDYHVVPIECLYGAVEVKSRLGIAELESTWQKTRRLHTMPKTAYHPPVLIEHETTVYGKQWKYFPTVSLIFAYTGVPLRSLAEYMVQLSKDTPPEQRVSSVWVLDQGMILPADSTGIRQSPMATSGWAVCRSDNPLLALTMVIQEMFSIAWMPRLRLRDYLENIDFGHIEAHLQIEYLA